MGESSFGKYRLIAELGHGGMADVFLAVQAGPVGSGFTKLSVVKRLRQSLAEEPEFVAMLVDEARIAARLNHPNVVQTNEVGEFSGHYFISMEYLDGQPLHRIQHRSAQRAKEGNPTRIDRDAQYVVLMDTLAGLHHAHELADFDGTPLDIVHRDVTPHNIFVTYDGQVKVVDFGIAKAAGRSTETQQGIVKGKVRYMAPEQAIGQSVDRRADIFSVGVMLWECASGRRLWRDMDDMQIVQALISGDFPRSPSNVTPDVPPLLDAICTKALAHRADDRHSTAEELRQEIEEYLVEAGTLVTARRKLPTVLNDLFSDKRREIREIIEKQLAALDVRQSGELVALQLDVTGSGSVQGASRSGTPPSGRGPYGFTSEPHQSLASLLPSPLSPSSAPQQPTDATVMLSMSPKTRPAGSRTIPVVVGIALAAALATTVGVVMQRGQPRPATVQADEMWLRVSTSPPGSQITVDDGLPRPAPIEARVARDGNPHRLHVEADGYLPKNEVVVFSQDVMLSLSLAKAPEPATPTPTTPKTKSTPLTVAPWRPTPKPPEPPPVVVAAAATPSAPAPLTLEKKSSKLGLDKTDPWVDAGSK